MALNPFFLQGSGSEQFLVQDLINEQLRMYGIEVYYLPRKLISVDDVLNDVETSKFGDNFLIEAYLDNYEGYAPGSDVMSKFGLRLKNEVNLIISRERFEEFISPFLNNIELQDDSDLLVTTRPKEGDLIFFPLGNRLFEIKRVEHEKPFYQLGKNYVFEIQCELFEYENEIIDTDVAEIDESVQEEGYITTLNLAGTGITATAYSEIGDGVLRKLVLTDDGSGYTSIPTVAISTSPTGRSIDNATAVAITTSRGGIKSIEELIVTFGGRGYTSPPTVTITGGGGSGAAATSIISDDAINKIVLTNVGDEYYSKPTVTISNPTGPGAESTVTVSSAGTVTSTTISTGGKYYNPNTSPEVTFSAPSNRINGVTLLNPSSPLPQGSNFTSGVYTTTNVSLGATGTGLTLDVTVNGSGAVTSAEIADPGQYYANGHVVNITNGQGGASGTVSFAVVTAENIDGVTATGIASVSSAGIVTSISITNAGVGYYSGATVSIANTVGDKIYTSGLTTAIATATVGSSGTVTSINIVDAGIGYTSAPTITISSPDVSVGGTFIYNEIVTGSNSNATAYVRDFDGDLTLRVGINTGQFRSGETIVGSASSASYILKSYDNYSYEEEYDKNEEIEIEADNILDFTESNPFGEF